MAALLAAAVVAAPTRAAGDDFRFRLRGDLRLEYTDNLWHYSDARLDRFDVENGSGERFQNLDSEADVVGRLRLRTDYRWRLAGKRHLRLSLDGTWFQHLENGLADYGEVRGGARFDATRRDRLELAVDRTFDRFKKNYQIADSVLFDGAHYDQTDATLGYTRRLGRKKHKWFAGVDLGLRDRRYNDPFAGRDLDGVYLTLRASYGLSPRVDAETSVGYGDVDSGTELDAGILVDRSYDQLVLAQTFDVRLGDRVGAGIDLRFRLRDYTTGVAADLGRHRREDENLRLRVSLERELDNGVTLWLGASVTDNESNRLDPTVETDETGYDELTAGVGLAYRF